MGAIAALVLGVFVMVMLIGAMVATVRQDRTTHRPATSGAGSDSRPNNRLAA
jgi:uncharacterized membrane protein